MSIEAMKLALEALKLAGGNLCEALHHPKKLQHGIGEPCPAVAKYDEAIASLRQAIEQAQKHDHQAQASNGLRDAMNRSMDIAKQAQPEIKQDRHELQAKGEHPAPCARFCEANAFQIEIRSLKAKLEQAQKQKPVAEIDMEADAWGENETYFLKWIVPIQFMPVGTKLYPEPIIKDKNT